ncbi:hypothetical protein ACKWTF_016267 [Chironomus riparius]
MKLIFVVAAIFIIGTYAGSPSYNPLPFPITSPLSCGEIEILVNQLSEAAREALKSQVLQRPRLLDLGNLLNGNLLGSVLSGILSGLNILNLDKVLLSNILSPTIVLPKSDIDTEFDPTWNCLVNFFESE